MLNYKTCTIVFLLLCLTITLLAGCGGALTKADLDKYLTKYKKGDIQQADKLRKKFSELPDELRDEAVFIMAEMGDTIFVDAFKAWIKRYDETISETIVEATGILGHPDGSIVIREYLYQYNDVKVELCVNSMAQIGASTIPYCLEFIADTLQNVRAVGEEVLVVVGEESIDPVIEEYNDMGEVTREIAARTLNRIGEKSYQALISQLEVSKNATLARDVYQLGGEAAVPVLLDSLRVAGYSLRKKIKQELVELNDIGIPLISEAMNKPFEEGEEKEKVIKYKIELAKILNDIPTQAAYDVLIDGSKMEDPSLSLYCLRYIASRPKQSATSAMVELIRRGEPDIQRKAKEILIAIGPPVAGEVSELQNDPDSKIRALAGEILSTIGVSVSDAQMQKGLMDPNPNLRFQALENMSVKDNKQGLTMALPLILDDFTMVRQGTISLLKRSKSDGYLIVLKSLKGGNDVTWPKDNMRTDECLSSLIYTISHFGEAAAINDIASIWEELGPQSRLTAYQVFIELGSKRRGKNYLNSVLNRYTSPSLLATTLSAMAYLNYKADLETVKSFINHKDPALRTYTAEYIADLKFSGCEEELNYQLMRETYSPSILAQLGALKTIGTDYQVDNVSRFLFHQKHEIKYTALEVIEAIGKNVEKDLSKTQTIPNIFSIGFPQVIKMLAYEGEYERAIKLTRRSLSLLNKMRKLNENEKDRKNELVTSYSIKQTLLDKLANEHKEMKTYNDLYITKNWLLFEEQYAGAPPANLSANKYNPKDLSAIDNGFEYSQSVGLLKKDEHNFYFDGFSVSMYDSDKRNDVIAGNYSYSSKNGVFVIELDFENLTGSMRALSTERFLAKTASGALLPVSSDSEKIIMIGEPQLSTIFRVTSGKKFRVKLSFELKDVEDNVKSILLFPTAYLETGPIEFEVK